VHGSWQHLVSNTLPILVLGTLSLYAYPRASRRALPMIWLLSGIGTWLIGRESSHIGASGLGHGLMFFLFTLGVSRWEPRSIAVALVTFLLYGGMLVTILPREEGISWEYHLTGAAAGVVAALLWRRLAPVLVGDRGGTRPRGRGTRGGPVRAAPPGLGSRAVGAPRRRRRAASAAVSRRSRAAPRRQSDGRGSADLDPALKNGA
jgi:hypothetical protein